MAETKLAKFFLSNFRDTNSNKENDDKIPNERSRLNVDETASNVEDDAIDGIANEDENDENGTPDAVESHEDHVVGNGVGDQNDEPTLRLDG